MLLSSFVSCSGWRITPPRRTTRQHLDRKPAYYTAKKKKRNTQEKVPAQGTAVTCFTFLHTFNPLIADVFRICSAILYLLISFGLRDQRNRTGLLSLGIYCRFIKDMLSVQKHHMHTGLVSRPGN